MGAERTAVNGIAVCDLTSLWNEMLRRNRDSDLSGNGVNHPSDFGHRVYAPAILTLLVEATRATWLETRLSEGDGVPLRRNPRRSSANGSRLSPRHCLAQSRQAVARPITVTSFGPGHPARYHRSADMAENVSETKFGVDR